MDYKKAYNFSRNLLAAPFIWSVLIPLIFLDLFMELYHRICFPLYRLPYINRSQYIKIDRYRLSYLKWWEKLGCLYCGYANGLLHYCSAIAGETEKYWCGIKHQKDPNFVEPMHHKNFMEYGDEQAYIKLERHYQELQNKEDESKHV